MCVMGNLVHQLANVDTREFTYGTSTTELLAVHPQVPRHVHDAECVKMPKSSRQCINILHQVPIQWWMSNFRLNSSVETETDRVTAEATA